MSALRKIAHTDELTGGYRWNWIFETLSDPALTISTDARILLCVLLSHHGRNGVTVGIRRLSLMCGMSFGRCCAARDELVDAGLIKCRIGEGTRATDFYMVALEAWHAAKVAARSVPVSPPSVPDPPVSVREDRTKPIEPESKKPVLKIVREGWPSLVHLAPDLQREHWLKHLVFDGRDADGTIRLTAPNTLIQSTVKKMFGEDPAIISLARKLGIDPEKVEIRSAKKPGADLPAESRVRDGEPGGHDHKRSMGRMFRENMDRAADRFEADDGPAPPPSRPHNIKVTNLDAYRTKLRDKNDLGKDD